MWMFFADDSRQRKPSRKGMGPLVAIGGFGVPCEQIGKLERGINELCLQTGFPEKADSPQKKEIKWSPGNNQWMRTGLVNDDRLEFWRKLLGLLGDAGGRVIVVIEDTKKKPAIKTSTSAEMDVLHLFLERVNMFLDDRDDDGLIVVDRPGGGRKQEDSFLSDCLDALEVGTEYVKHERIALNLLTASSSHVRLLQLADVVVGSALAFFGGEDVHSPPVFEMVKPLFHCAWDKVTGTRIGGVGLKVQPALKYANLYHWLLGDEFFWQGTKGWSLPSSSYSYSIDPLKP